MNFDLALKEIYRQRVFALSKENYRLRQILSLAVANGGRLEEADLEWAVENLSKCDGNILYVNEE